MIEFEQSSETFATPNRSIAQRLPGESLTTHPLIVTYDFYDASGNLTDVWQPAVVDGGSTSTTAVMPHWHYDYDQSGNEIDQVSPTGHNSSGTVTSTGNTTTFGYDQNGNQVRQTLPDGEMQTWTYDLFGNSTSHKVYSATNHTTALQTTLDVYDTSAAEGGRLLIENRYASDVNVGSTAIPNERTTYIYDDNTSLPTDEQTDQGHITEADDYMLVSGSLVLSSYTHYTYDILNGQQASITTPEGTINYVYDGATGELVETWTGTSHSSPQNDILYGYDTQGRLASVTQVVLNDATPSSVSGGHRYDADGNSISTTEPTTLYGYDAAGNVVSVADPNGDTTGLGKVCHRRNLQASCKPKRFARASLVTAGEALYFSDKLIIAGPPANINPCHS